MGKQKYGNFCLDAENQKVALDFAKEGDYARWSKGKHRVYFVFQYTTAKDAITLNTGDEKAFKAIAEAAKLPKKHEVAYDTPAGWLTKYLTQNGSDKIFPAAKVEKLTRVKP